MKNDDFPGFEDIVETIREPLLVLDANLNILSANRSFYTIFKVEQGESIGHLIFAVGNKQWDIPALRTLLEEILPTRKRFDNYEVEHDFPTIGHKTMLLNARKVYRKDVGTQMILLAIEDITERKKVEKALEANEEKYRELVQNANSIILKMDPKGKVTFFNEFAQMFFGYTEEEMLGCSVVGTIVPETESSGRDLEFMIRDIGIHPEKSTNNENENMRRNGERVWVAWTNKAIRDGNGKVIEILCIGNDITEHRRLESLLEESEERYRRLFETANDGILLLEKHEGKITHANPAATKMVGYSKEECIGKKLQNIGVPLDMGNFQKVMQTLDKSGIIYYDDVPVKTKAGQYIDTDIYMVDRARLVQCNIRDITERKRAAEVIKKNEEQLRNLTAYMRKVTEMERTNIAREIHDELGQALTILKMDLSLFRKTVPEDQPSMLEKTDAMSRLIDKTIQTVQRISTDLRPGLLDDLGLSAAIEWQLEEFQKRTGCTCKIIIDPKDVTFDSDRNTALFRILQETLTNIARHAEATEVSVSLKQKDGQIELKVQDNGRGITEEELTHPQSFGLIGIRERAVIFGGGSNVKGFPGKGTTVTVKIPAKNNEERR
ncbi:MAG: domain S-box [Nitrospirae bacterium]|nr:domain S-box [Nitrospirota bacterium]